MSSGADLGGRGEVVSLHGKSGYQPDMAGIARSHISSARQRMLMTEGEFAAVLTSVLGWPVTEGVVRRWETEATPPGDALIAAGVVSRAAPMRADTAGADDLMRQLLGNRFADIEAVFVTRSEFIAKVPLEELFEGARTIDAAGLSLNLLCQQFSDHQLRTLIEAGTVVRCAFLAPWHSAIEQREAEEGYAPGELSRLTDMNIQILGQRVRQRLGPELRERLQIRIYNEPIRFNIMTVDNTIAVVQPYLPSTRGIESPTFLLRSRPTSSGLFGTFDGVFHWLWARSSEPA